MIVICWRISTRSLCVEYISGMMADGIVYDDDVFYSKQMVLMYLCSQCVAVKH